jgi:Uma2 family endonuclease
MQAVIANMPRRWLEEHKSSAAAQWDEMWNGVLHMPPMPNGMHQDFSLDLASYIKWRWAKPLGGRVRQEVNLTTPADEAQWTLNYRIPDIVLLDRDRLHIDKNEYMVGAPLVVVEIKSPGDETYAKFPFYAGLGVPEVWVFDRDTKAPEIHTLSGGPAYQPLAAAPGGWLTSPAAGVAFRQTQTGRVWVRIGTDDATAEELPEA